MADIGPILLIASGVVVSRFAPWMERVRAVAPVRWPLPNAWPSSGDVVSTLRHIVAPPYYGQVPSPTVVVDQKFKLEGVVVEELSPGVRVPIPGAVLRLFYRQTGALVAKGRSDALGQFKFKGLLGGAGRYILVAALESGAPLPNAKIYDRLSAVE